MEYELRFDQGWGGQAWRCVGCPLSLITREYTGQPYCTGIDLHHEHTARLKVPDASLTPETVTPKPPCTITSFSRIG